MNPQILVPKTNAYAVRLHLYMYHTLSVSEEGRWLTQPWFPCVRLPALGTICSLLAYADIFFSLFVTKVRKHTLRNLLKRLLQSARRRKFLYLLLTRESVP